MRKEVKLTLLAAGIIGAVLAGKETVSAIDNAMTPKFENSGYSPTMPDEPREWVRPTNWRITVVDGRDGTQHRLTTK